MEWPTQKGFLCLVLGVSGSGKGTLLSKLKAEPDPRFTFPLSVRSRVPRAGEVHGVHSWFWTPEAFVQGITDGVFFEYALVYGLTYYGTLTSDIMEDGILAGKIVIKEIDVQGLKIILNTHPELESRIVRVFLNLDDATIVERNAERNLDPKELEARVITAQGERKTAIELGCTILDATLPPDTVYETFLAAVEAATTKTQQ